MASQNFQHLTVCTHLGFVGYLWLTHLCSDGACEANGTLWQIREILRAASFPLTAVVGIGFWLLATVSPVKSLPAPWTMLPRDDFPADEKAALQEARHILSPTWHPLLAIHVGFIQLQHTAMPLYPWLEEYLYPEPPTLSAATELTATLCCGCAWLLWVMLVTWPARGSPPYPILRAIWREGSWRLFYSAFIALGIGFTWAGRAYRGAARVAAR